MSDLVNDALAVLAELREPDKLGLLALVAGQDV